MDCDTKAKVKDTKESDKTQLVERAGEKSKTDFIMEDRFEISKK